MMCVGALTDDEVIEGTEWFYVGMGDKEEADAVEDEGFEGGDGGKGMPELDRNVVGGEEGSSSTDDVQAGEVKEGD